MESRTRKYLAYLDTDANINANIHKFVEIHNFGFATYDRIWKDLVHNENTYNKLAYYRAMFDIALIEEDASGAKRVEKWYFKD